MLTQRMERIAEGSREGSATSLVDDLLEGRGGFEDGSLQNALFGRGGMFTHQVVDSHYYARPEHASGVYIEQLAPEEDEELSRPRVSSTSSRSLRARDREMYDNPSASSLRVRELERQIQEMDMSMHPAPSASSLRARELERQLSEKQSAPSASSLRVKELERQLQEKQSAPSASSLRVKELEKQLQETQSAPSASSLRVKELERQLQEKQSAPSASSLRVKELERQLQEQQSAPSASSLRVKELERQLQEKQSAPSASALRVVELERQLEEAKRTKDSRLKYLQDKHTTANAARRSQIINSTKQAKSLDLAFVLDATLSMRKTIQMVKNKMAGIANQVISMFPDCHMRVAVVLYRDYDSQSRGGDDGCDFTTSFRGEDSTFVSAMSRVKVLSGGDFAEDVFTGLERVAALSWSAATRVVVHIGDAPCHGTRFHDPAFNVGDDYPQGDKLGRNLGTLLENIRSKCDVTVYYFCHLQAMTHKMLQEFRKEAGPDHKWLEEAEFRDVDEIPPKVVEVARRSIRQSIIHSVAAAGCGGQKRNLLPQQIDPCHPTDPAWRRSDKVPTLKVYKHKEYESLDALLLKVRTSRSLEVEEMPALELEISRYPFTDEGAVRWPYYARATDRNGTVSIKVLKRFKGYVGEDVNKRHDERLYADQMEVQTVSSHMAEEFNRVTVSKNMIGVKRLHFGLVCTVQVKSTGWFYNMEDELPGMKRFNSNAGYIQQFAATLEAFSHWSLERSGGVLMVTDLQGVMTGKGSRGGEMAYLLSDPAIHCEEDVSRFTPTNRGKEGFDDFFNTHRCNDICKHLGLKVGKNGFTQQGTHVR